MNGPYSRVPQPQEHTEPVGASRACVHLSKRKRYLTCMADPTTANTAMITAWPPMATPDQVCIGRKGACRSSLDRHSSSSTLTNCLWWVRGRRME
jgi:hypothetical protein